MTNFLTVFLTVFLSVLALGASGGACSRGGGGKPQAADEATATSHPSHDDRTTVIVLTPSSSSLPVGLTMPQFETAAMRAAAAWSFPAVSCTSIKIEIAKAGAHRLATEDGRNVIVFRQKEWCHNDRCGPLGTFPLSAAAMTSVYPEGAIPGGVKEADVELNGASFEWLVEADDTTPAPLTGFATPDGGVAKHAATNVVSRRRAPLTAVLLHEMGHVLGFSDACGSGHGARRAPDVTTSCSPEERRSVMWSGSKQRAPTDWDKGRLCASFPR